MLRIRMKKTSDGGSALTCVREDGSSTWQRLEGKSAGFFPHHDLTHFAVETVLGHRRGFYGLVAEGWDLTDFGTPWPRGPIPADAEPSELIVGFLDLERASRAKLTAADLRETTLQYYTAETLPPLPDDEQLAQIRACREELFAQWEALAPSETLELMFHLG